MICTETSGPFQSCSSHGLRSLENVARPMMKVWGWLTLRAAVEGRDQAPASLRSPDAQGVGLQRIDADNVMHAVPLNRAERLEDGRAYGLCFFKLFGSKKFEPDLTLSRHVTFCFLLPF
jgi:hypothetical protein